MKPRKLSIGARILLLMVALLTDGVQFLAELLLIGFIIDPIMSVVTTMIFWIVLQHNGIQMFGGKRFWSGWTTTLVELIPGIDGIVPTWTAYAVYLAAFPPSE